MGILSFVEQSQGRHFRHTTKVSARDLISMKREAYRETQLELARRRVAERIELETFHIPKLVEPTADWHVPESRPDVPDIPEAVYHIPETSVMVAAEQAPTASNRPERASGGVREHVRACSGIIAVWASGVRLSPVPVRVR